MVQYSISSAIFSLLLVTVTHVEIKSPLNLHKPPTEADQFSTDSTNSSLSGFLTRPQLLV